MLGRPFHPDPPFGQGAGAPVQMPRPASPAQPSPMQPQPRPMGAPPAQPRPPVMPAAGVPGPAPTPVARPDPVGQGAPPAAQPGFPVARPPGAPGTDVGSPKIRALDQKLGGVRHEDNWARSPNVTGTGAVHVRSFHCKLTGDALENLDRQINEWLDAHPQYEVKFVNTSIGDWTGKLKEPNLIVQVWV